MSCMELYLHGYLPGRNDGSDYMNYTKRGANRSRAIKNKLRKKRKGVRKR